MGQAPTHPTEAMMIIQRLKLTGAASVDFGSCKAMMAARVSFRRWTIIMTSLGWVGACPN